VSGGRVRRLMRMWLRGGRVAVRSGMVWTATEPTRPNDSVPRLRGPNVGCSLNLRTPQLHAFRLLYTRRGQGTQGNQNSP
jgi:hypothetical protein